MGGSESAEDQVDWARKPVETVLDAEAAFVWVVRHYFYFDRETRLDRTDAIDSNISKWSKAHPGEFIQLLSSDQFLQKLARTPCREGTNKAGAETSCAKMFLMCFPSVPKKGTRSFPELKELFATIDPQAMLRLLIKLKSDVYAEYKGDFLQWLHLTRTLGEEIFESSPLKEAAPPELRDTICYCAFKTPLPSILPSEETIVKMSKVQVEEMICSYTLEAIGNLESRLRPGGDSEHGFIGYLQSIGQIILDDAATLLRLKVKREDIAQRLELIIAYEATLAFKHNKVTDPPRWAKIEAEYNRLKELVGLDVELTWAVASMGDTERQPDPFHPTFDNPTVKAEEEYFIMLLSDMGPVNGAIVGDCERWPPGKHLRFSRLHPPFVRRLCFFEGPEMYYRLDPEQAARVLKLI